MAVNKNFVVKNGLEVGTDLILANTNNSRVGIGTSLPTDTLHVNGGIAGTDFVISGIATIPTLNSTTGTITNLSATTISMGSTAIVNSARQLQNIESLDSTTTATIEAAIESGPNTFTNLNITGVSTFVGLATFGSGIEVQSGVSTFAGTVDINGGGQANTFKVEDLTNSRVVLAGTGGELEDSTNLTFDGNTLTAAGVNVVGVTTSGGLIDANGGVSISGGSGLQVTGAATVSTTLGVTGDTTLGAALGVTGNATIAGINTFTSDGANILGIVTATAFHGDISNATGVSTNIVASVGIQSGGNPVGSGITGLNFIGAGNSILVNSSNAAIVDISIAGGGGAGAATSVGGNAPVDPELGQLWYNNDLARTFIWYDEAKLSLGTTAYWVDAAPFDMQGQFIERTGATMTGALGIATGSLAAPGLFISGSTNTGIAALKPNEFSFTSSGTEKFNVNATGARIVGTTTVTGNINAIDGVFTGNVTVGGTLTKQDVTNVDAVGLITARQGVNIVGAYPLSLGTGTTIHAVANNILALGTNGAERVRIDDTGKIGINSTSPDSNFVLHGGDDNPNLLLKRNTGGGDVASISWAAQNANPQTVAKINYRGGAAPGGLQFYSGGATSSELRMLINPTGLVGIGTIDPQEKVDIRGNVVIGIDQVSGNPGTTVGVTTIRGHHVNSDGDFAQLYFSNSKSAGGGATPTASIRGRRSGDNYGTNLSFYTNPGGSVAPAERLRIGTSGEIGIAGANYGTAGQVIKSGGAGASVAWGDATVGVSSAGSSIGNATTLNFIGAGNTFAVSGSTIDISIAGGGGGGGSGDFNTSLSGEFYGNVIGIGATVFTFPSTAGIKYILRSLLATNVSTAATDVNVIGAFDFNGGERSYFGYNIPLPVGMAAEMLKEPQIMNPSDKILMRSTDIDRNGVDSAVQYYGVYETLESGTDYTGVGLGTATLNNTSLNTIYTSTSVPSVVQSIRIANVTDAGPKPISVYMNSHKWVDNLVIPKYGSVEICDKQKRIPAGATIQVQLDEASSMGVQLSAKKITAT